MTNLTTLPLLADKINEHYEQAESHAKSAVDHAYECGLALIEAKAQCGHGEWLPWLEKYTVVSKRTAQAWMQIAANPELVKSATAAHLTLRDTIKQLSKPKIPAFSSLDKMTPEERHECVAKGDSVHANEVRHSVLQTFVLILSADGMTIEDIAEYLLVSELDVVKAKIFDPTEEWKEGHIGSLFESAKDAHLNAIGRFTQDEFVKDMCEDGDYEQDPDTGWVKPTLQGIDRALADNKQAYQRSKKRDAYLGASSILRESRPVLSEKMYAKGMEIFYNQIRNGCAYEQVTL